MATKTEECGRKLRDVAKICFAKASNTDVNDIPSDSKVCQTKDVSQSYKADFFQEVDQCQAAILLTEEALLEALCFDFVIYSPHSELVDLFAAHEDDPSIQEYAWSFAHDSCVPHTITKS